MCSSDLELGKPIQSDIKNEKITYTSFYTVDACYGIACELTQKAIACLDRIEGNTDLLREIASSLVYRKH